MDKQRGKVAIVTGGTSGFGLAISRAFVRQGVNVAVFARGETADLERTKQKLILEEKGKVICLEQGYYD